MSAPLVGHFNISVTKAKDLRKVQSIGKQDPYARIEGPLGQKKETKPHEDGGSSAVWNTEFTIVYGEQGDTKDRNLRVSVWDQNVGLDSNIGHINFTPHEALKLAEDGKAHWHHLKSEKGADAGEIELALTFHPGIAIEVHEAKDLRVVQLIGKQDPYVQIIVGDQKSRTKEHENGGKTPKWNETHYFARWPNVDYDENNENAVWFNVWDADVVIDEQIGVLKLPFSALELAILRKQGQRWYPLFRKKNEKENAGWLSLTFHALAVHKSYH